MFNKPFALKPFLLILVSACWRCAICQFTEGHQPSSVYKQNNVKARIMTYRSNKWDTKLADFFDHEGRVKEHVVFDTTGENITWRIKYEYDTSGYRSKETSYNYLHFDTTDKQYHLFSPPEVMVSKLEFDSLKRIIKRTRISTNGNRVFENVVSYNPLSERVVWRYEDGGIHEIATVCEAGWIEKELIEVRHFANGEKDSVRFEYKNEFDNSGRIISRKAKKTTPDSISKKLLFYFKECFYEYSSTGLLVRQVSKNISDKSDRQMIRLFDYKFW